MAFKHSLPSDEGCRPCVSISGAEMAVQADDVPDDEAPAPMTGSGARDTKSYEVQLRTSSERVC